MLMSLALGEVRDTLQIYARQVGSAAFVESLCAAVSEFKNGGVSPEELAAAARESGDAQLREKAAELSTIYEVYNALLESRYTDTADDLQRACRLVEDQMCIRDSPSSTTIPPPARLSLGERAWFVLPSRWLPKPALIS